MKIFLSAVESKSLRFALMLAGMVSMTAFANDYAPAEVTREGIIDAVSLADSKLTIMALRYGVSETAHIEIGGSYGALSMLSVGMRVAFTFNRYKDGRREITKLRELAANEELVLL
mgnify:FL=1